MRPLFAHRPFSLPIAPPSPPPPLRAFSSHSDHPPSQPPPPPPPPRPEHQIEQQLLIRQQLRKSRLTASVFCHAIGFWKGRRIQLWQEKIGLREPFAGNAATIWADIKEDAALQRYKEITGNQVKHLLFKSYPETSSIPDWMGASPDGLIEMRRTALLDQKGILEIKCPFNRGDPKKGVPWPFVPYNYMPQAQGLMEIFDRDWMDFYVWTMNGSSVFRILRNADLWELIYTALNDFWWVHVMPARYILSKDSKADIDRYKPRPQHALCLAIASKCRQVAGRSELVFNEVTEKSRSLFKGR